jgi:hypothetical protein
LRLALPCPGAQILDGEQIDPQARHLVELLAHACHHLQGAEATLAGGLEADIEGAVVHRRAAPDERGCARDRRIAEHDIAGLFLQLRHGLEGDIG